MSKSKMTISIDSTILANFKLLCAARGEYVSQNLEDYMNDFIIENYEDIIEELVERGFKNAKR